MPTELPAPTPRRPAEWRLTGRVVLASLIGFFVVVATANAVMMTVAIRTMPGVEVKSAYETSQHFNEDIARMRAQAERGWKADAAVTRDGDATTVSLTLLDRAGAPLPGLAVAAGLQHPATRAEDRAAALVETGPGRYAARLPALHPGAWTLTLAARRGDETVFETRSRILVKE